MIEKKLPVWHKDILEEGRKLFKHKNVSELNYYFETNSFIAKINQGYQSFTTKIILANENTIDSFSCTCSEHQYYSYYYCKHAVALLKAIQENWHRFETDIRKIQNHSNNKTFFKFF